MKLLLTLILCVFVTFRPARAEQIFLSQTPDAGLCVLQTTPGILFTVYVVHTASPGAKGSTWRIENTSSAFSLGGSCGGLSITGDPFTGISVNYGGCLGGAFTICQLSFISFVSPIPGCYHVNVRPFPGNSAVEVVGCDDTARSVTGGYFSFDPHGKGGGCDDCATATEPTTWGSVKALYR